jgi:apolipoprotein N-acyltransferase
MRISLSPKDFVLIALAAGLAALCQDNAAFASGCTVGTLALVPLVGSRTAAGHGPPRMVGRL